MTLPRKLADKYEIRGVLGEGGTGIVYDAIAPDGSAVALKVMHAALAGDKQIRGRFQREATILRRLEGEHVCPILDFGEALAPIEDDEDDATSDRPAVLYIALPKISGGSLAELLAKPNGSMPLLTGASAGARTSVPPGAARPPLLDVERGLEIVLQILEALRSAHAQGVIHRDLKPANVLLEGGTKVIVVDFGMSKIVTGAGVGTTNLTTHNMVFGTPEYMSPEQARGDELDVRCDVYAVGVILYELLTGAPPFVGSSPLSVLTAHLTSDLVPPRAVPGMEDRISPALEAVVLHALARDRTQRYPSAAVLAAAVQVARAEKDNTIAVRPSAFSTTPSGTTPFAATIPATAGAMMAIDGTAPTLVAAKAPLLVASTPPRAPSEAPKKPRISAPPPDSATNRTWILLWILVGLGSIAVGVYIALRF